MLCCRNINPYVAAAITDWQKQHSLQAALPRQTAAAAAKEAAGLHGTSSFGMSGVNAHLLLSPPPHPHTSTTRNTAAPTFHPPTFSRSRVWPAPRTFHSVQMVRVSGMKAQFAADLTHPAMAPFWTTKVGGSRIIPTSMHLEAAGAAASLAAAAASGSGVSLQGVIVQGNMVLDMGNTPAGTRSAAVLHIELDTSNGLLGVSSASQMQLTASTAPLGGHQSMPHATHKTPGAMLAVSEAARDALLASADRKPRHGSAVGVADRSVSFQDGFRTHCGQAEAVLTLASANMSATARPAQTLTACGSILLSTPHTQAGQSAAEAWTSANPACRKDGLLSTDSRLLNHPGPCMTFTSAVFGSHPAALQPSSLGLQLLWKPTPLATPSSQAYHRKWLLICTDQSGDARIFAEASDTGMGQEPQITRVILGDRTETLERSAASSRHAAVPHFVGSEEELQQIVERADADHCFIVQPRDITSSGTYPTF